MKKIFGGRFASNSANVALPNVEGSNGVPRNVPRLDFEILHQGSCPNVTDQNHVANTRDSPRHSFDETASYEESVALSDSETLNNDPSRRLDLQETYNENFTAYIPYILQQARLEQRRSSGPERPCTQNRSQNNPRTSPLGLPSSDDLPTIINEDIDLDPQVAHNLILNKPTSKFNLKREFLVINEFFKSTTYIFLGAASFELFKFLRSNQKKLRKNSLIVFDSDGTIKKLSNVNKNEIDGSKLEYTIDKRSHIIPVDYKLKGKGLPLFKVHVPYLSTFRKNTPLIIFKRYREIPLKPSDVDAKHDEVENDKEDFETYTFCTVHSKHFHRVRRLTFNFNVDSNNSFKVILFMNNFRPFSDFTYNNTRFRVVGTPVANGFVNLNMELKLLIIDDGRPSLCDDIINKKSTGLVSSITKRGTSNQMEMEYDTQNVSTYPNPYPNPSNEILDEDLYVGHSNNSRNYFYSRNLPPFGNFKSLENWDPTIKIPKKYSEIAKLEIYQDNSTIETDIDSTLSADLDSQVICCIMTTLREVVVRNAYKVPQSRSSLLAIPAVMDQTIFAPEPIYL